MSEGKYGPVPSEYVDDAMDRPDVAGDRRTSGAGGLLLAVIAGLLMLLAAAKLAHGLVGLVS